jgi:ADP-ribose pyrophosphatase YjhB (NUDIX family)
VNPSPAVAVLVTSGNHVLLCKRAPGTGHAGLWCLPSGHIEYDEDFITAGLREVEEEAGVRVEITGILSVVSNFWDHGSSTFVAVLLANYLDGELRPDGVETVEVAWFRAGSLPTTDMAWGADEHIIARFFATRDIGAKVDPSYARADQRDPTYVPPRASRHLW